MASVPALAQHQQQTTPFYHQVVNRLLRRHPPEEPRATQATGGDGLNPSDQQSLYRLRDHDAQQGDAPPSLWAHFTRAQPDAVHAGSGAHVRHPQAPLSKATTQTLDVAQTAAGTHMAPLPAPESLEEKQAAFAKWFTGLVRYQSIPTVIANATMGMMRTLPTSYFDTNQQRAAAVGCVRIAFKWIDDGFEAKKHCDALNYYLDPRPASWGLYEFTLLSHLNWMLTRFFVVSTPHMSAPIPLRAIAGGGLDSPLQDAMVLIAPRGPQRGQNPFGRNALARQNEMPPNRAPSQSGATGMSMQQHEGMPPTGVHRVRAHARGTFVDRPVVAHEMHAISRAKQRQTGHVQHDPSRQHHATATTTAQQQRQRFAYGEARTSDESASRRRAYARRNARRQNALAEHEAWSHGDGDHERSYAATSLIPVAAAAAAAATPSRRRHSRTEASTSTSPLSSADRALGQFPLRQAYDQTMGAEERGDVRAKQTHVDHPMVTRSRAKRYAMVAASGAENTSPGDRGASTNRVGHDAHAKHINTDNAHWNDLNGMPRVEIETSDDPRAALSLIPTDP